MHSTRVTRGEEASDQFPAPVASDLGFATLDDFHEADRSEAMSLKRMIPSHLHLRTKRMPLLFGLGVDLYARQDLTGSILDQKTPGLGFPFPPLTVEFES